MVNVSARWRVRALWVGAGTYFLILLNDLRYWGHFPLVTEIFGTLLNLGILTVLMVNIRKAYESPKSEAASDSNQQSYTATDDRNRRRIRVIWTAAVLYFVVMVVAIPHAMKLPYQIFLLCAVLNWVVIIAFIVALRRLYVKPRRG